MSSQKCYTFVRFWGSEYYELLQNNYKYRAKVLKMKNGTATEFGVAFLSQSYSLLTAPNQQSESLENQ